MNNLKEAYQELINTLDCKDNSCMYKRPDENGRYGMRTNGGCRCLGIRTLPNNQRWALVKLLKEVEKLVG